MPNKSLRSPYNEDKKKIDQQYFSTFVLKLNSNAANQYVIYRKYVDEAGCVCVCT